MSTLQNLVVACQADDTQLRQQEQTHTENWQAWLAPVSDNGRKKAIIWQSFPAYSRRD